MDAAGEPPADVRVARARQPGATRGHAGIGCRQRDRVVRRCRGADACGRTCTRSPAAWRRGWASAGSVPTVTAQPRRTMLFVRSIESWQARGAQLDRGPDAGAGADPGLGARRQPAGVGDPRGTPVSDTFRSRRSDRRCCGCWPASRSPTGRRPASCAASSSSTGAAPRPARPQARRASPVVDLARWAGMAAGVRAPRPPSGCARPATRARCRRARRARSRTPRAVHRAAHRAPGRPAARRRGARRPPGPGDLSPLTRAI